MRLVLPLVFAMLVLRAGTIDAVEPVPALKGFDPVALADGKEVSGRSDLTATHGIYRYQFVDEANRRKFLSDPERFAIQMGGGCARMGPLAGLGNPDRFLVHEGRIYIFASDGCRSSFQKAPARFLAPEEPELQASEDLIKRGRALLEKAVTATGGPAVDSVRTLEIRSGLVWKEGEQEYRGERILQVAFPERFLEEEVWDQSRYGHGMTPRGGFRFSGTKVLPTEPVVDRAMWADFLHHPFVLLRLRNQPGLEVAAAGTGMVGDQAVDLVHVRFHRNATEIALDQKSGRIVRISFRSWGAGGVGKFDRHFSDYREVDGRLIPFAVREEFDGKPISNLSVTPASVKFNQDLDAARFVRPE